MLEIESLLEDLVNGACSEGFGEVLGLLFLASDVGVFSFLGWRPAKRVGRLLGRAGSASERAFIKCGDSGGCLATGHPLVVS